MKYAKFDRWISSCLGEFFVSKRAPLWFSYHISDKYVVFMNNLPVTHTQPSIIVRRRNHAGIVPLVTCVLRISYNVSQKLYVSFTHLERLFQPISAAFEMIIIDNNQTWHIANKSSSDTFRSSHDARSALRLLPRYMGALLKYLHLRLLSVVILCKSSFSFR